MGREEIATKLKAGVQAFRYTKKEGEVRFSIGTLNPAIISVFMDGVKTETLKRTVKVFLEYLPTAEFGKVKDKADEIQGILDSYGDKKPETGYQHGYVITYFDLQALGFRRLLPETFLGFVES